MGRGGGRSGWIGGGEMWAKGIDVEGGDEDMAVTCEGVMIWLWYDCVIFYMPAD